MTTVTTPVIDVSREVTRTMSRPSSFTAFVTLARRRFALSAHTPREILVPLLTPVLFAAHTDGTLYRLR